MRVLEGFCLFVCGLQLSSAQDMNCTVTQDDKQTTYNISGVSHVSDVEALDYSWANKSDHVLANNKGSIPGLVLRNSINTLVTSECIDEIVLTRHCVSEGTHNRAICVNNCTLNALRRSLKDKEISRYRIAGIVPAVFLLLVVFLVFLCCKRRDRTPSFDQLVQTVVKTPKQLEAGDE